MPNGMDHKPPRILVLSASVGAGHLRAAEAVELALRETAPDAFVRNLDVLETTNRTFRRLYGRSYLGLMNRAPYVHGYFYDLFDRPGRAPSRAPTASASPWNGSTCGASFVSCKPNRGTSSSTRTSCPPRSSPRCGGGANSTCRR